MPLPPLRPLLRDRLTAARRERDRAVTAAVRSALAALDNAEAVDASGRSALGTVGVGSSEVERRTLTDGDEVALVRAEVDDLRAAATTYDEHGRSAEAADAVRAADALDALLARVS